MSANNEIPIEKVKEKAEKLHLIVLDRIHKDGRTMIKVLCKDHPDKGERLVGQYALLYKSKTCGCLKTKYTLSDFLENNQIDENIKIIGPYKNISTKILCMCKICGYKWDISPNKLQQGRGCPECNKKRIKRLFMLTQKEFEERVSKIDPTIKIISKYEGTKEKIKYECLICHKVFETKAGKILSGESSCHFCKASKGERRISLFLDRQGIVYEKERKFEGCKAKKCLPFDFYIPKYNLVIEYQGEQHYYPVDFSYTPTTESKEKALRIFGEIRQRDEIKKEFCKKNKIDFLEISYRDYNKIEEIITNRLNLQP